MCILSELNDLDYVPSVIYYFKDIAWGHLISWYKQTYCISPSAVGNYIANLTDVIHCIIEQKCCRF